MRTKTPRLSRGLSLVELMIAMTLGLITIAAVGWIYLGTTKTYRTQDGLARLQEGARFAFEIIGNDMRMTGTTGCSSKAYTNVLKDYSTQWWHQFLDQAPNFALPLYAEDKDPSGTFTMSDGLRVLHADISKEYLIASHAGSTITVKDGTGLAGGSILVATDCNQVSVFRAATVAGTSITYDTTFNTTTNLGDGGVAYTFDPAFGARLYRLSANTYYVATNPAGQPALYRDRLQSDGNVVSEELIEGVEDLQVSFIVDENGDGIPDTPDPSAPYLTPTQIKNDPVPSGNLSDRWGKVVSARISLVMRSVEDNVVDKKGSAADRRLRKIFTHVVKLRNR